MSIAARNEERALFARRLYDIGINVGIAFHAAYNDDTQTATDRLDDVLKYIDRLGREYNTPLSDEQENDRG